MLCPSVFQLRSKAKQRDKGCSIAFFCSRPVTDEVSEALVAKKKEAVGEAQSRVSRSECTPSLEICSEVRKTSLRKSHFRGGFAPQAPPEASWPSSLMPSASTLCPAPPAARIPLASAPCPTPSSEVYVVSPSYKPRTQRGGAGTAAFLVQHNCMQLLEWQAIAIAQCPDNIYAETIGCQQATLLAAQWYAKLAPDGPLHVVIQGDILPLIQYLKYNARLRYADNLIDIKHTALLELPNHTFAYLPREGNALADHPAGQGANATPPTDGIELRTNIRLPDTLLQRTPTTAGSLLAPISRPSHGASAVPCQTHHQQASSRTCRAVLAYQQRRQGTTICPRPSCAAAAQAAACPPLRTHARRS